MAIVFPSDAAKTRNSFNTASLRHVFEQIVSPHEETSPTLRIKYAYKQSQALNLNEKFEIPMKIKDVNPAVAKKSDTMPLNDIDHLLTQEWGVVALKSGVATNERDAAHARGPLALFNLIDLKVDSMHAGMTKVLNALELWDWNSSDISGNEIDISTLLANAQLPPEELALTNVTAATDIAYSLPMAARKTVNGHTFGGITTTTTTNKFWQPVVTDADGATVTRSPSGDNVDMVTAVSLAVPLTHDDLFDHLSKVQENKQYDLVAPVGRNIYKQLQGMVQSGDIRPFDSPVADLGIKSAITWDQFNVTFYMEPKMDALWPTSIFFFDPTCYYMVTDEAFDPMAGTGISPWEKISGTTVWGTMVNLVYQNVCEDRRGVSAMHGFTSDA